MSKAGAIRAFQTLSVELSSKATNRVPIQSLFRLWFRSRNIEAVMKKLLIVETIMKRLLIVEAIGLIVILTGIVVMAQQIP